MKEIVIGTIKGLLVAGLLLAISSDGIARSWLLSSTRQAIKEHGARGLATAGALLMLCTSGCENIQGDIFARSYNPSATSAGSVELFRSTGETGSYVGDHADYVVRAPGESEVLRRDRPAGVTVAYHEREDVGDLAINIIDSGQGVLSESYYLAFVEDNGSYTIYDRIGPGRVEIGSGTTESDHLRLNFTGEAIGGQISVTAYLYSPMIDQTNDRVERQLRLEYLNRPWGLGRADMEISSQMFWSGIQTVVADNRPTTVGLRSVGDMYRESYSGGASKRHIFSANDGSIRLLDQSGQQFQVVEELRITVDELYAKQGEIAQLMIYLDRNVGESMQFNLAFTQPEKSKKTGGVVVFNSSSGEELGNGTLSDEHLRLSFTNSVGLIDIDLQPPIVGNSLVFRNSLIQVTPPESTSVFGQTSATQTIFQAKIKWDAESSARLSE